MRLKEIWKPIKGYEGLYEVSNMGQVRSLNYNKTGKVKMLKLMITRGYHAVNLHKNGKLKRFSVHRLVVIGFIGPIPKGMQVNHINENKLDNRLENLEIVTHKENQNHGTRNERIGKASSKELKLTNAKTCAKYTFSSSAEASEFFGYKDNCTVSCYIFKARKKGKNFIKIRKNKYYFAQQ